MVPRRTLYAQAFGTVLMQHRLKIGLCKEDLARKAGISLTYPHLLEEGRRQPSISILCDLAPALQLSPEELLRETLLELQRTQRC